MQLPSVIIASEIPAEQETIIKGKVEKRSGKRVGFNYIIVKSYKESQKNDVVKCLYIKSLTKFGFCVIKEGSYGDTKDKHGRDIIDRLKWQQQLHQELQDKICMPRLLGHFEEHGNYYLVIEHIRGKALQKVAAEKRKELRQSIIKGGKLGRQFLDYLIQIANILETLHLQQIVHRDATPNNYMITPGGKVALIDMEMCYSMQTLFPTPAFQLGTYGYMSPQQEKTQVPTPAEDIFALGAIILQLWSGVSPGKLTNESIIELSKKISFFIPDKQLSELVLQCLLPEDSRRPSASQILQGLKQYKTDLKNKAARPVNQSIPFTRETILTTVQEAIDTLATPLLADEENGWFAEDMKPAIEGDKHKLRKVYYASYDRGVTGVIYVLAQAKALGFNVDSTLPFIEKGIALVKDKYINQLERKQGGLHYGADGIAAVIATSIEKGLIEADSEILEWVPKLLEKDIESWGMISGIAGQGIANLRSKYFTNPTMLEEKLEKIATILISKQDKKGCWVTSYHKSNFFQKKRKIIPLGFGEGMAGIIYYLLEFGYRYDHQKSILAAKIGLQWLIKKASHKNGSVSWYTSKGKELHFGWSDGAAGIALTFLKAYELTRDNSYKNFAKRVLQAIPKDIIDGNISQRSGLCGLGEVYLEAYTILKEPEWLNRAEWLVQVIMQLKKDHPKHGNYWLVEYERNPVANFMVGNSGVLHFLLRFWHPDKMSFPIFHITK